MVKGITEDPHFVGLGGPWDCLLRTTLKNCGKLSKWRKASLRIVTEFSVAGLGDHQMRTALKNVEEVSQW
jgi:hypothetical protein